MVSGVHKMIQMCKELGLDTGWIPGSGRSLGGGTATHSSVLACLENPMNRSLVTTVPDEGFVSRIHTKLSEFSKKTNNPIFRKRK